MSRRAQAGLGIALLGLHVALFPTIVSCAHREDLRVTVPIASGALVIADGHVPEDGVVPKSIAGRTALWIDGAPATGKRLAPGVHREEWQVQYRGGFTRRVGRTILAGPLQDPKHPPCGIWLTITQPLIDGLAQLLSARIADSLSGRFGFQGVDSLDMHFSDSGGGALVTIIDLRFRLGVLEVKVWITPRLDGGTLALDSHTEATVTIRNKIARGAVQLFRQQDRLDDYATQAAASEVEKAVSPLQAMFAVPPPVPLGGGRALTLSYCKDAAIVIETRKRASIPLSLDGYPDALGMQPILLASAYTPPPYEAPVSLDLDLNAVNAILHHVWASGYFDEILAKQHLESWFNEQDVVRDLLTIRAGGLRLTLPPTLEPNHGPGALAHPLTLSTEAGLIITDEGVLPFLRTPARVFGRVDLAIAPSPSADGHIVTDLALHDLALTCEPAPGRLEPCYASLVDQAKDNAGDLDAPVAHALATWLEKLVVGQQFGGESGSPHFTVKGARLSIRPDAKQSAWLRMELDGPIEETPE